MFYLYEGDPGDLPTDKNYINFRWSEERIFFSVTKKGDSALIHLSAKGKRAKLRLVEATEAFCDDIFQNCDWCKRILGLPINDGIMELALEAGFKLIGKVKNIYVMTKERK